MRLSSNFTGILSALILIAYSNSFAGAASSIPISQLGAEADKKAPVQGVTVTSEGLKLCAPMQKLEAYVAPKGAIIRSVSESEGKGDFSINPVSLGRASYKEIVPAIGIVSSQDEHSVLLDREMVLEQFSASSDGIRQDFVINKKPAGKGELSLSLTIKKAKVTTERNGIAIAIPAGRKFVYGNLKVTDANGKTLGAKMEAVSGRALEITVEDAGAKYPVTIDPTITDADWTAMNGLLGVDNIVQNMVYAKGILYVSGTFSIAGTIPASCLATWNGSVWDTLRSSIMEYKIIYVDNMIADKNGNIVIVANYSDKQCIARWNGAAWDTLLANIEGVFSIACDSIGNLYIGGDFTASGEAFINRHVARWNGAGWSALGSGTDSAVVALACDNIGNLFAAGYFDSAGGVKANHLAKWDGTKWNALGTGLNKCVRGITFDGKGILYAGGDFDLAGAISSNHIAKWDGNTWTALGAGIRGPYHNIGFLALRFDKSGNLYVGGHFDSAGEVAANNIAQWNGNYWKALGAGVEIYPGDYQGVYAVECDDQGNLFIGGDFPKAGNITARHIAQWNGKDWNSLGPKTPGWGIDGVINSSVFNLAVDFSGNLFTTGYLFATGIGVAGAAKWNGSGWQNNIQGYLMKAIAKTQFINKDLAGISSKEIRDALKSPSIRTNKISQTACNDRMDIFCTAIDTASEYSTCGYFKWNGSQWDSIGTTQFPVRNIVCDPNGILYVNEWFLTSEGVSCSQLRKWDGVKWINFAGFSGTNARNVIDMICDEKGNLFVAGDFSAVNGDSLCTANSLAFWNGKKWKSLEIGSGIVLSNFLALAFDNKGNLFTANNYLYQWDGTLWNKLGGVGYGHINSIAIVDSLLYIGGDFNTVGKDYSPYIAKLNIHSSSNSVINKSGLIVSKIVVRYGMSKSVLTISNLTKIDRISLYSLSGRCIRQAEGVSKMNLTGIAPQPLFVRVSRAGKIVSTGMVIVE